MENENDTPSSPSPTKQIFEMNTEPLPDSTLEYAEARERARLEVERLAEYLSDPACTPGERQEINQIIRTNRDAVTAAAFVAIRQRVIDFESESARRKHSTLR